MNTTVKTWIMTVSILAIGAVAAGAAHADEIGLGFDQILVDQNAGSVQVQKQQASQELGLGFDQIVPQVQTVEVGQGFDQMLKDSQAQ